MYITLTLFSYLFDKIFGEFSFLRSYTHPVILMGNYIKWFEKKFYQDSIRRGFFLTFSLVTIVFFITYFIESNISNIIFLSLLGSTAISANMLKQSVQDIIQNPTNIKYLVSRDTTNLSQHDINKAGIETYAENLSDGVIAPLFYMLLFGLCGAFVYKAINTLDSMVGYRTKRYENFGKVSAKLDDIINFIPSRVTAILIALFFFDFNALKKLWSFGKRHDSPNAGYPISAMALALDVKLGGPTSYFGKIKQKAYFGEKEKILKKDDILKAVKFNHYLDIFFLILLIIYILTSLKPLSF